MNLFWIIGLLIILCLVIILVFTKPKDKTDIKSNKDYWIEHYPLRDKYVVVYKNEYPFLCVGGYWSLHSSPSSHEMFSTKKEAVERLNLFLEWQGKDVIRIEV